jgi:hypothetical protein
LTSPPPPIDGHGTAMSLSILFFRLHGKIIFFFFDYTYNDCM